jgi:hypothetical protein
MPTTQPIGLWTVEMDEVRFIATSVEETGGNRIVRRERPYRDGAKLDDTGSKPRSWRVETVWNNTFEEDGVQAGIVWWRDELERFLVSARAHETGDLQLATVGRVRARLEDYSYKEANEYPDTAWVSVLFVEDNEDSVDGTALGVFRPRAAMQAAADQTVFSLELFGSFSQFVEDLENACTALEEAIAWPGEMVQDVDQKAARVVRCVEGIERQFFRTADFGTERLSDPESWAAWRQMRLTADLAARAIEDKSSGVGKVVSIVLDTAMSIFDAAAKYAQDPQQLMDLNSDVEDFLLVPIGTTLRIFQKTT